MKIDVNAGNHLIRKYVTQVCKLNIYLAKEMDFFVPIPIVMIFTYFLL